MFFGASKILWALIQPLNFLFLLMALGLLLSLKWEKAGIRLLILSVSLFLLLGFLPIGHSMMVYLETRYERPAKLPKEVEGIILLGGAVNAELSIVHKYPVTYNSAERLSDAIQLSRKYPVAEFVVSGGSGHFGRPDAKETPFVSLYLRQLRVSNPWVIYEDKSRNTYENALFSDALVLPNKGERWILITSAFHMPRAVAAFDKVGWEVIPYPTDHRTSGRHEWFPEGFSLLENYEHLDIALREFVGIAVYYLTGKSTLFWPGKIVRSGE